MSPAPKYVRHSVRWLVPAALLALTPKCVLCLLAYAGIGSVLGLGAPEICGATEPSMTTLWSATFVLGAVALTAIGLYARRRSATKTYRNR